MSEGANSEIDPQQMRYGMLGEDLETPDEKLEKFRGQVNWDYLEGPCQNGVLFYVDPALTLTAVGEAFQQDRKSEVEAWLKSGDLVTLGELHAKQWRGTLTAFEALVVSPFVLCQLVPAQG